MKTAYKLSGLLLLAGCAFLIAAPQYARCAFAAPASTDPHNNTALEVVFGVPAVVFCIAGLAATIAAVVVLFTYREDTP